MLNFTHLRAFAATAETGNVSRAAEQLRVSQPVLSHQIRELEATLGVALLERLPRGVRLTQAGELLSGYARQCFALAEEAEAGLAALRDLRQGRLRLGASLTIGVYLLPPLLAEARRRWPGLEIKVAIENTEAIHRGLVEHALDLGLTEGPGPHDARLQHRVFAWDELVIIAAADATDTPRLTPAQLAALPWILREPGSGTRAVADRALGRLGVRITPAWTFNNPEAIKQAVQAGCGVALVPRITVTAELAAGRLREIAVPALRARRPLRLQWLRGRPLSPALRAFSALCGYEPPARRVVRNQAEASRFSKP